MRDHRPALTMAEKENSAAQGGDTLFSPYKMGNFNLSHRLLFFTSFTSLTKMYSNFNVFLNYQFFFFQSLFITLQAKHERSIFKIIISPEKRLVFVRWHNMVRVQGSAGAHDKMQGFEGNSTSSASRVLLSKINTRWFSHHWRHFDLFHCSWVRTLFFFSHHYIIILFF